MRPERHWCSMDPTAIDFGALSWLAIGLSLVAVMVLGAVWYAPWSPTGKVWMRHMGLDPANPPAAPGGRLLASVALMGLGSFLMLFVFAHTNMIYEDAFRNAATGGRPGYELDLGDTLTGAVFTWLGFIVPVQLNAVAFENKPWSLFFVNAGFYLSILLVAAVMLVVVG